MVEFHDYPNVLIRMLNNCIKEPHSHLVVFVMQHDVNARLDFIQVGRRPSDSDGHDDAKNHENKQQTTSPEAPPHARERGSFLLCIYRSPRKASK